MTAKPLGQNETKGVSIFCIPRPTNDAAAQAASAPPSASGISATIDSTIETSSDTSQIAGTLRRRPQAARLHFMF
jgi:hypothetical protein